MDEPSFYGFPTYGEAGPKTAQDCGGQPTTPRRGPSSATRPPSSGSDDFMAEHLPGALGPPILTRTCLYTLTPDRDFVVDRVPDAPGVVVGLGRGPRLQVRQRPGPGPGRARPGRRRRHRTASWAPSASIGRSCWRTRRRRAGWSDGLGDAAGDARERTRSLHGPPACAKVPPIGSGGSGRDRCAGGTELRSRVGDPAGTRSRRYRCDHPCAPDWAAPSPRPV